MLTHDVPDAGDGVRRMRRRLRRTLMRRLRREQSGRFWTRIVLSPVRRAVEDLLASGALLDDLRGAGLDGVRSALMLLCREVDVAMTSIAREES